MKTILYISRSLLPPDTAPEAVKAMIDQARLRNRHDGITGGLIFTGDNFAQLVEGPDRQIDALLARIGKDLRHDRLTILAEYPCITRRFARWDMAYQGLSSYVDRHIRPLFGSVSDGERQEGSAALLELMFAFMSGDHPSVAKRQSAAPTRR
jgi:hypothetical protein